jgi:hypothetical protein
MARTRSNEGPGRWLLGLRVANLDRPATRLQPGSARTSRLVATMNLCPCGARGDTAAQCACTPQRIYRYREKLSRALLDRFDLALTVPRARGDDLAGPPGEPSEAVRERVVAARRRLTAAAPRLGEESSRLLTRAVERLPLSGRGLITSRSNSTSFIVLTASSPALSATYTYLVMFASSREAHLASAHPLEGGALFVHRHKLPTVLAKVIEERLHPTAA